MMRYWLVAAALAAHAVPAAAQPPAEALDALRPLAGERPGCAAGVIEQGRLTHARGYGLADLETRRPITPATPFNIASMSKQFTAAAAALLIAEGRLREADDIRRWLPELRDYGHVIRVRDLLQHSSGLRNHMALAAFHPGSGLPTHEEALALVFRQSALNFVPGTRHQYESPSYVLLAEVVARAAGKPFDEVLAERIFRPLGMTSTGFAVPGQARAYAARPDGSFVLNEAVNTARGSSGIVTTVEDFARWLAALSSGRFGGPGFLARMTSGGRLADGTILGYGYGLSLTRDAARGADALMIGHGGQTAAYRSTFSYFPGRGFGVVLLCNVSNAPLNVAGTAVEAWRGQTGLASPEDAGRDAQPLTAAEAARLAGHYHDPAAGLVRTFTAEGPALRLSYFGQPIPLTHLGNGRFAVGETARFAFADGAVMIEEPNQPPVRFTRLPPPGVVRPGAYAGTYRSADVDEPLVLRAEGDALIVQVKGRDARLQPIHPDGFAAPEADFAHVGFLRDPQDRVIGLTLTTSSGINRMRYDRVAGP